MRGEIDRRSAVRLIAGGLAGVAGARNLFGAPDRKSAKLSPADDAFLDDLQRRGCLYFVEQAGPATGQVLDRAKARGLDGARDKRVAASIAATGFGLSALCIAEKRGYFPSAQVREQVRRTLHFHANEMPTEHGFFSHFNDVNTGAQLVWSEISSIDTALLLCGVLTARAHFSSDPEIVRLATAIYERVDWPWMLDGGINFSMAWGKKAGFLKVRWDHYCEMMMLPLLAIGSPTHPVVVSSWDTWTRPKMSYNGLTYIGGPDPLFVHQYSHAWFDFRNKRDRYADYFANSVAATRAHQAFCLRRGKPYTLDYWGITASDSISGYRAWGGPPMIGGVDGSVVPCATAGSLPFLFADCMRVLKALKANYGEQVWGRYGFCDAFHPEVGWFNQDVIGIDLGISVLMAENLRTGFIWETFARNVEVRTAMRKVGFRAL